MVVLGIDTATSATAVGLGLADGTMLERRDDPGDGTHPGHATQLLAFARELLVEGGVGWGDLQRIAVVAGPGRFTGLRVGVATGRGLAHALGAELVGVSSLRALAHGAARSGAGQPLLAVIDARRGEVFAAAYAAVGGERLRELDLGTPLRPAELGGAVARAADLARAEQGCIAVGDGALRYRAELEGCGAIVPGDDDPAHRIRAGAVCVLGLAAAPGDRSEVVPDYRRDADAARARAPHAAARG